MLVYLFHSSKTPGGRLVYLYAKKPGKAPSCGDCHLNLQGVSCCLAESLVCEHDDNLFATLLQVPALRPKKLMSISKPKKTVTRAYGGSICGRCVRERWIYLWPAHLAIHLPSTLLARLLLWLGVLSASLITVAWVCSFSPTHVLAKTLGWTHPGKIKDTLQTDFNPGHICSPFRTASTMFILWTWLPSCHVSLCLKSQCFLCCCHHEDMFFS